MSTSDLLLTVVVLVLIALAGVLASAEVIITRTSKVRAYHLVEEGRRGASSLVKIVDNPAPYLSVVLLIILALHLTGTTIAAVIAVRAFGGRLGEILATVIMTILLFVFAEVSPKTFAIQHTDRVALRVAPLVVALTRLFGPLARGLITVANIILPGKGIREGPFVTEAEIKALAEVASEEDSIEEEEKDMIHSIFEFGDTVVREVMTPEPDIVAVEASTKLDEVLDTLLKHGYSRIPVYKENLEEIVGIVYAKDVLKQIHSGRNGKKTVKDLARKALFVPESKRVAELLKQMQQEQVHVAIVVDEYGAVAGLVTLEDLLEEIVGEIADEYDREEPQVEPAGDGSYLVNARMPVDELSELLDVELPQEEWDTVGGLMMGLLGRLPGQGEEVELAGLKFTAERVKGRRIAKVLVERVAEPKVVEEPS
jgi:CBS domain containing-hemolysin-like protein